MWKVDILFSVCQKDQELLSEYVARFKVIALEVYNLDEFVAMLAMKRGLKISRFTYFLDKKPSRIYSELLSRAQKYIHVEIDHT